MMDSKYFPVSFYWVVAYQGISGKEKGRAQKGVCVSFLGAILYRLNILPMF